MRWITPSTSICRSCWMSIFWEIAGIARSRSEKRSTLPPKRWNRITSFQRPSRILRASSTPRAAEVGVNRSLPLGEYLTFSWVLVIWRAYFYTRIYATKDHLAGDPRMSDNLELDGRRALVTGGTKGIG